MTEQGRSHHIFHVNPLKEWKEGKRTVALIRKVEVEEAAEGGFPCEDSE